MPPKSQVMRSRNASENIRSLYPGESVAHGVRSQDDWVDHGAMSSSEVSVPPDVDETLSCSDEVSQQGSCDDEGQADPFDVQAIEEAEQRRLQISLLCSQNILARSQVLNEYATTRGAKKHVDYMEALDKLHDDMRKPYPTDYISLVDYLRFLGYTIRAAQQIAGVFGPDVRRVYRAERKCEPETYTGIFPGADKAISVYHRFRDAELLGSCWRIFTANKPWFKAKWPDPPQRGVDERRLEVMKWESTGKPARGWKEQKRRLPRQGAREGGGGRPINGNGCAYTGESTSSVRRGSPP